MEIKSTINMKKLLFLCALLAISQTFSFAQTVNNSVALKCKLDEVTVFFNGAMLTHSTQIKLQEGTTKLLVSNISSSIDEKIYSFICTQ